MFLSIHASEAKILSEHMLLFVCFCKYVLQMVVFLLDSIIDYKGSIIKYDINVQ